VALELLSPVPEAVLASSMLMPPQTLGNQILKNTHQDGFPDLSEARVALVGIQETRSVGQPHQRKQDLSAIRKSLYALFAGNWPNVIADLGDLPIGDSESDSHRVLQDVASELYKQNILLLAFGGSQENLLGLSAVFTQHETYFNLCSIDYKFDFGVHGVLIDNESYMSKLISARPNFLLNYCNLGYQSYYVAQEELDLVERLYFDAVRLGELHADMKVSEPYLRDSDIVTIDMSSVISQVLGGGLTQVNGFTAHQICVLARYVGLSDRVGMVSLNNIPQTPEAAQLAGQTLWYIIEGLQHRANEYPFSISDGSTKYVVPHDEHELTFYQSTTTKRWWVLVPVTNNNIEEYTLLPCNESDYLSSIEGIIPERWWRTMRRNLV